MNHRKRPDDVRVNIQKLVLPPGHNVADFASRIEREIADRRFGPGTDPQITAIAARIVEQLASTKESM
jgi:hypothetical protein